MVVNVNLLYGLKIMQVCPLIIFSIICKCSAWQIRPKNKFIQISDTGCHPGARTTKATCLTFISMLYLDKEVLLTSAERLVLMCCLFISRSLMFISQISPADWGHAETTYNLYEVLFKVHKVC